jgi:hypothetical protein
MKTVIYSGYKLMEDGVVTYPSRINKIKDDTTDGVVARMGDTNMFTGVLWRNLWERK